MCADVHRTGIERDSEPFHLRFRITGTDPEGVCTIITCKE